MTKYEIVINIDKLWDMCSYWTLNRAFQKQDPNLSRQNLNDTYGLTSDDKDFFFSDYMQTVCNKLVLSPLFKLLIKYNRTAFGRNISFDYTLNKVSFFIVASDEMPAEEFNSVLYKYLQFKILWYWYKLKNREELLPRIEFLLASFEDSLTSIIADNSSDTDASVGRLTYNDGFVINPPYHRQTTGNIPSRDDATTVIGDSQDPTSQPNVPDVPNPPVVPVFTDNNTYFFGVNLPLSLALDPSNIQHGELYTEIHLQGSLNSDKLRYKMRLLKNPAHIIGNNLYDGGLLISDFTDNSYLELDLSALSNFLPYIHSRNPHGNLSPYLHIGDKIYYEFEYLTRDGDTGTSSVVIASNLCEILPVQIFENIFASEFE